MSEKKHNQILSFVVVVAVLFGVFALVRGYLASGPELSAVTPRALSPGQPFVLVGSGFAATAADNLVDLGGQPCVVTETGPNHLVAVAPRSLASGMVTVQVRGKVSNPLPVMAGGGMGGAPRGLMPGREATPNNGTGMTQDAPAGDSQMTAMAHEFYGPDEAKEAPGFSLETRDGHKVGIKDFRGKVVLVNFWASWCEPCIAELPSLLRMRAAMPGDKLEVLAVSVDKNWDDVAKLVDLSRTGDAPVYLLDPEAKVPAAYGTVKFPETYIVDHQGRIVAKFIGSRTWDSDLFKNFFNSLFAAMDAPANPRPDTTPPGASGLPAGHPPVPGQ